MRSSHIVTAVLSVGFVLMWSSGFIGARLAADTGGTVGVLMWRFLVAAAVLSGWVAWRRRHRASKPPLTARDVRSQVVIGLLSQACYLGGTVLAVQFGVAPGTSSLIAALQPLLAAALSGPLLGVSVPTRQWLGLAVGLGGVIIVVGSDLHAAHLGPAWAFALPFLGMAGLVAGTLVERRSTSRPPIIECLAVQCTTSAIVFSVAAAAVGQAGPPADGRFWLAVAWAVVLATAGGYGLYWVTLRRTDLTRVNSLIYLTPPVTILWAFLMFGEPLTWPAATGTGVCLAGVLLVQRKTVARKRSGATLSDGVEAPLVTCK